MAHYPFDRIATQEEIDWALAWLRSVEPSNSEYAHSKSAARDMIALKVASPNSYEPNDPKRLKKISAFIWARVGQQPNFGELLDYLKTDDAKIKSHTAKALKKRKLARKRGRVGRKR